MRENINHIISRIKWDTQVLDRGIALDFQNRISDWSNTTMVREVNPVFDNLCPENRTWRINRLELDLGTLDYNYLEEELLHRMLKSLSEQLSELLIKSKYESIGLEIINEELGDIQLVTFFLRNGYLPWYNNSKGKPINQIVNELFHANRMDTILVFRDLIKIPNIRKRIVWQFDTDNVKHIIRGIEPTNSDFIFSFSSTINKIQKNENIVKSSSTNLRKSIWLWIINHLVEERGTLFNKVEFVKSTILQMANHYNISYEILLKLIIKVTKQNVYYASYNAPLIKALKIIEKESDTTNTKNYTRNSSNDAGDFDTKLLFGDKSSGIRYKRVEKLALKLLDILQSNAFFSNDFVKLQILWGRVVEFKPKAVHKLFCRSKKNNQGFELLLYLLNDYQLQYLFQNLNNASTSTLKAFADCLTNIEKTSHFHTIAQLTLKQFYKSYFTVLGNKQKVKKEDKTRSIVLDVILKNPKGLSREMNEMLKILEQNKKIGKLLKDEIFDLLKSFTSTQDIVDFALKFISRFPGCKSEIITFLFTKVGRSEIEIKDLISAHNGRNLLRKLLPVSLPEIEHLINDFIRKYLPYGSEKSINSFNKSLWVLVWYCALDSTNEQASKKDEFLKSIRKSIYFKYPSIKQNDESLHAKVSIGKSDGFERETIKAIKNALKNHTAYVEIGEKRIELNDYLIELFENSPSILIEGLYDIQVTEKLIASFKNCFGFDTFLTKAIRFSKDAQKKSLQSLAYLFFIIQELSESRTKSLILNQFWWFALKLLARAQSEEELKKAVLLMLDFSAESSNVKRTISEILKANDLTLPISLSGLIASQDKNFDIERLTSVEVLKSDILTRCIKLNMADELVSAMLLSDHIPAWYKCVSNDSEEEVYKQIFTFWPGVILDRIKHNHIADTSILKLANVVTLENILTIIKKQQPGKSYLINQLKLVAQVFETIKIDTYLSIQLRSILGLIILKGWAYNNWKSTSPKEFWQNLSKIVLSKCKLSPKEFVHMISAQKDRLPPSYKLSFESFAKANKSCLEDKSVSVSYSKENLNIETEMSNTIKEVIPIENAGIVLLGNYFLMLFERLDLLKDGDFADEKSKIKAIQILHFLSSGSVDSEESMLSLNKVICGSPINNAVPDHLDISQNEKELMEGLLKAVIGHWSAIGDTSIDGFRGNWIVRNGMLTEMEDRWELTIEKRAYDLLIGQSPFSFAIIKYGWMDKPIHVNWPY